MSEEKSESAFRSISEVAGSLNVETHVLRFWETKFDIIQPLKRAAGRRFYRPEDVQVIAGIQCLLHEDGLTIKGVQKIIKDHGADYVRARAEGDGALPGEGTGLTKPQRDQLSSARDQLGQIRLRLLGNETG
ncbi:MAG: MerR family transcriptional regulator [Pseudomonadota bacterium]|nr:MerR family transcriptional regulator [Pseudomonadota bacterium]